MFKRGVFVAEVMVGLIGAYLVYSGQYEAAMGCIAVIGATLDKLLDKSTP